MLAAQTAAAMRLGPGPTPPQSGGATIATPTGEATFAVGGDAQCAAPAPTSPMRDSGGMCGLSAALARGGGPRSRAARVPYTGTHIAARTPGRPAPLSADEFERELGQYRDDLDGGGALPVYPAASVTDAQVQGGGVETFDAAILGGLVGAVPPGTPAPPPGTGRLRLRIAGQRRTVRVIVLDYSGSQLAPGELNWLVTQPRMPGLPACRRS